MPVIARKYREIPSVRQAFEFFIVSIILFSTGRTCGMNLEFCEDSRRSSPPCHYSVPASHCWPLNHYIKA